MLTDLEEVGGFGEFVHFDDTTSEGALAGALGNVVEGVRASQLKFVVADGTAVDGRCPGEFNGTSRSPSRINNDSGQFT